MALSTVVTNCGRRCEINLHSKSAPTPPGWPRVNPWPGSQHTSPVCHGDKDLLPAPRETVAGKSLPEVCKVVLSTLCRYLSPHRGCLDSRRRTGIPVPPFPMDLFCLVSSGQCWTRLSGCGAAGVVEERGCVPGPACHVVFVFIYRLK